MTKTLIDQNSAKVSIIPSDPQSPLFEKSYELYILHKHPNPEDVILENIASTHSYLWNINEYIWKPYQLSE